MRGPASLVFVAMLSGVSQILPPPTDGEIRVVYWELRNQTDIFLTILPQSVQAGSAPSAMSLTFTWTFAGHHANVAATGATPIEVKATAGMMWAPQASLWLDVDGAHVDLAPSNPGLVMGAGADYLLGTTTVDMLIRIAAAKRVTGNALGFSFELTEAQRRSIAAFVGRLRAPSLARL